MAGGIGGGGVKASLCWVTGSRTGGSIVGCGEIGTRCARAMRMGSSGLGAGVGAVGSGSLNSSAASGCGEETEFLEIRCSSRSTRCCKARTVPAR